ncbi:GDP-mannose-dependent alpha-(1-6)-phosphatidylinositol monomannoside mannosyltransferase [Thiorhodovibrio winogradskyi]|uniref:GDP-mannose-dependent alpha-(1-6)-phosphatidylinositol monomannoside mannosyltransferase n=1 Tax=Thiorhodovibrio winogradskyi TaxID=77007 RepID=A0ABZ0SG95_9GAMM|nr:glycosyltransferase family 4 protein [Thiorhodovibrio winogradskyi]
MKLKIAWVLINVSHYHAARWKAVFHVPDYDASIIEIANRDASFAQLENKDKTSLQRLTLFPQQNWREIPGWKRQRAICKALEAIGPDVVCLNGWSVGGGLAALHWCLLNQRRSVIFSDSNAFDKSRYRLLEHIKNRLVALTDSALVAGSASRDYLLSMGFPPSRIFTGYDAVDNDHFSRDCEDHPISVYPGIFSNGDFFLAAARFEDKKNHLRLIDAYDLYRRKAAPNAWPLVILGDGYLRSEIEAKRETLALEDSIVLPGFVGYDELPVWYQGATCFIHPSTTEQWGLVINEAMASGLPVLVSNRCGCAPDLVEEGRNGYTFDPYDVDALAGLMLKISSDDCDRAAMGQASREIIARWTPQTFAENLARAVEAASQAPRSKASLFDKALLWALMRR